MGKKVQKINNKQNKQIVCFIEDIAFDPQPIEVKEENIVWGKPKHYEIKDKEGADNESISI